MSYCQVNRRSSNSCRRYMARVFLKMRGKALFIACTQCAYRRWKRWVCRHKCHVDIYVTIYLLISSFLVEASENLYQMTRDSKTLISSAPNVKAACDAIDVVSLDSVVDLDVARHLHVWRHLCDDIYVMIFMYHHIYMFLYYSFFRLCGKIQAHRKHSVRNQSFSFQVWWCCDVFLWWIWCVLWCYDVFYDEYDVFYDVMMCLWCSDSASYFFNKIMTIGNPGYIPTQSDVLRYTYMCHITQSITFMS